eukprot:TRINITY_DN9667_c0_g1_i18.p1 TRINITY_DN9667_c0_g1~~TRINITY_DN9667_c0_g1_i18.p1  ORF type:complete len:145 (-),score=5.28 TRINITY_DN9667_c0_g1_i18:32-466(-)
MSSHKSQITIAEPKEAQTKLDEYQLIWPLYPGDPPLDENHPTMIQIMREMESRGDLVVAPRPPSTRSEKEENDILSPPHPEDCPLIAGLKVAVRVMRRLGTPIAQEPPLPSCEGALREGLGSIPKIGRAVQQECRDRSRMPSSA